MKKPRTRRGQVIVAYAGTGGQPSVTPAAESLAAVTVFRRRPRTARGRLSETQCRLRAAVAGVLKLMDFPLNRDAKPSKLAAFLAVAAGEPH
jgi:hypothetical protein